MQILKDNSSICHLFNIITPYLTIKIEKPYMHQVKGNKVDADNNNIPEGTEVLSLIYNK